jgi:hypothetical protein
VRTVTRARGRQPVERRAQVLADLAADLLGVGDDGGERAVLGQPLGGGLRADLVDAGHVVDAVADQGQEIDDLVGTHAELRQHAVGVEPLAAHGVHQRHLLVDQLRQVLVAGGDDGAHAVRLRLARQRADHVVGLDALDLQHRPAERGRTSWIGAICAARSGGIGGRCALYCG